MIKNGPNQKIAFVILAAGESKRMGNIKQLLQWRNKSLINHIIDKSFDSLADKTFVVLGANANKIQNIFKDKPVQTIYNHNWKNGLGSSISAATNHIKQQKVTYSGILFSLVDQPLINTEHFNNLIERFYSGEKGIVATNYEGNIGVPAIFSRSYFNKLIQLDKSDGAKIIIYAHRNDTATILSDHDYVDLDTPEDFANFLKNHS